MAGWASYPTPEKAETGPWGEPVTPAEPSVSPEPSPRRQASPRLKLSTVAHCKREIAGIYRECRRGEIKPEVATKLVHILEVQSRLIVDSEIEERANALLANG